MIGSADLAGYGIVPYGALPSEIQLAHYKMGKKAFIHFGMNTFTGAEWGHGAEDAAAFAPADVDTDQWIRVLKAAGFPLVILTVKHHDGFCLWPSAYTEHSVKNSPYRDGKGDILRQFTDSCRRFGVKAGFYISPWDRNSPHWGKDSYNDYFAAQLTEILTGYGELCEIWWDGAGSKDAQYDWGRWVELVRRHQPRAAIFGSMGAAQYVDLRWVGNERGEAGETHFASIDPQYLENETPAMLNVGEIGGLRYIPSETDVSIRPGWFWHADQDGAVKSVSELNRLWFTSVGRNSMLLLNIPPDRSGRIGKTDAENARASHQCISRMLAADFAAGAEIESEAEPIRLPDRDTVIRRGRVFDIRLPKPARINVFSVREFVEAGERITGFSLDGEAADGTVTRLWDGASVGFYRAVQIPEGEYVRFRFTVTESAAEPLLAGFGLHLFTDSAEEAAAVRLVNLAAGASASVRIRADGKTAEVAFGGIYPFNRIAFAMADAGRCTVEVFGGTVYETLFDGVCNAAAEIRLDEPVTGSYQIRIHAETGFLSADSITVMYE